MTFHKNISVVELQSIQSRLEQDGLKVNLSADQKLCHLWNCLQRSEEMCKGLVLELTKVRKCHAAELDEITKSMRYVSSISAERESVLLNLKSENSQIKTKLNELNMQMINIDPRLAEKLERILISEGYSHSLQGTIENQFRSVISNLQKSEKGLKQLKEENTRLSSSAKLCESSKRQIASELKRLKEDICTSNQEKELSYIAEIKVLSDAKAKWEREFLHCDKKVKEMQASVSFLNKQREVDKFNHQHEVAEIRRALEDELLRAVESKDDERRMASQKILEIKRMQVEHRMLQTKYSTLESENSRSQASITSLEETNRQLSSEIALLRQSNEQSIFEIESARIEIDKTLAREKDSFLQERSAMESSYSKRIQEVRQEVERLNDALKINYEQSEDHIKTIKTLEINFVDLQSRFKDQELEMENKIHKIKEQEYVEQSLRSHLTDVIAEKKAFESIILAKERETEELNYFIEESSMKLSDLDNLYKNAEESKFEIGKKLVNASGELASLQEHNSQLKDEIQSITAQLTRHQDLSLMEQEKFQIVVKELKDELDMLRGSIQNEKLENEKKLRTTSSEVSQLRTNIVKINLEKDKLKDTVHRLSTDQLDLNAALSQQSKGKTAAEAALLDMEAKLDATRQKHAELVQTIIALENSMRNVEKESDLKNKMLQQFQEMVKKKEVDLTLLTNENSKLQSEVCQYEQQVGKLNEEIGLAQENLERSLEKTACENNLLKNQLSDEEESRKLQSGIIAEFQKQLLLLEKEIAEKESGITSLLQTVEEKEDKLNELQQQQMMSKKEHGHSNERVIELSNENESLRMELLSGSETFDELKRNFDEQTIKMEHEFRSLGDRYSRERYAFETFIGQLRNNLEISQGRAYKEAEWTSSSEAKYRKVKEEYSSLITEMSVLQEKISSYSIDERKLALKVDHLEKENFELRTSIGRLTKEKLSLEKSYHQLENEA